MGSRPGREAIFEQLRADGVEYIFGNPGSSEENLLFAASAFPEIRYVLCLQESVAVAAADGYARATQRPAYVQLHAGVGLGNATGMLYQAFRGHSPLVVFSGEAGLRYVPMDGQMAAQLVEMARPVTKYAAQVTDPGSLLRILRRAHKIAATPPRGPVFVSFPMDVVDSPNTEVATATRVPSTRVAPESSTIEEAAAVLAKAQRPVIIVGDGVAVSGAQEELGALAVLLGAGVWGANSSEVNLPASHPMYCGLTGHMFGKDSARVTAGADVVLICGTYVFPEVFPCTSDVFGEGTRLIHIDLDPWEIGKNFPADLSFMADPKLTLRLLREAVPSLRSGEDRSRAEERAARIASENRRKAKEARDEDALRRSAAPLHLSVFAEHLAMRKRPEELVFFDEALTHSPELCRHMCLDIPGHYFQTRGGSLGVSVPGALGLKLACPEKTVVAFSGDGGAMYVPQALWTAAHDRIGAKFVICNNRSYRLLKLNILEYWKELGIGEQAYPRHFDLRDPDLRFDLLAESQGVAGVRVERPEEIPGAIDRMLADDRPFLIDLVLCDHVPGSGIGCPCSGDDAGTAAVSP